MGRYSASAATPCVLAAVAAIFIPGSALAQSQPQSASQVPPGETIVREGAQPAFRFPAAQGLIAPDGADAISFGLRDLQVDGGLPELSATTQALKPAPGAQVTVADIYSFAASLQGAYFEAGYPLVRVVVPTQDLDRETGLVRVLVVDGYVERIDTSALPHSARKRIDAILAPLVGRQPLRADAFERRLLLAGETAGVALESALSPGSRTGGTVLIISGEYRPVQAAVALDNGLSEDLGRWQTTASVALNGLSGLGERLVLSVAASPEDLSWSSQTLRRYASLYGELPIGTNGLSVGSELSYSASAPDGISAPLALQSDFTQASLFLSYATIRSRIRSQTVKLMFDAANEEQTTGILGFPIPLFTDRTRVMRLNVDGFEPILLGGRLGYELELSQGFDGFGARAIEDATPLRPLSRLNADAEFTRLAAGLSISMPLGGAFSAQAIIRGQTGFGDALLRSEQGNIASPDLISGPPPGSLVGDDTYAGRIEVRRSFDIGPARMLSYGFLAAGKTQLRDPLVGERPISETAALGLGLRFETPVKLGAAVFGRLEWSHVESEQSFADRAWTSFSITVRY